MNIRKTFGSLAISFFSFAKHKWICLSKLSATVRNMVKSCFLSYNLCFNILSCIFWIQSSSDTVRCTGLALTIRIDFLKLGRLVDNTYI